MPHFSAYEIIPGNVAQGILLLADHATARLPAEYGTLGLDESAFRRHIAYDIGIEPLTRALSAALGAPAVMSCFSRLLIDPNRGEDDPTLVMRISDGAIIPGNHPIDPQEWQRRLTTYHRPYHEAIASMIGRMTETAGQPPLVISLHSFTPVWKSFARPWHAAVLWDADPRAPHALLDLLAREDGLVVGDNEPYDGALRGDTLYRHCSVAGIAHLLLEVRQDLIDDAAGVERWCTRLAPAFEALNAMPDMHTYRRYPSRTGPFER
jgi:predicted N-formylglutamate amidohydrolase